jgi:hypothetical protein
MDSLWLTSHESPCLQQWLGPYLLKERLADHELSDILPGALKLELSLEFRKATQ